MVSDNEFDPELIALLVLVGAALASANAVNDAVVPDISPDKLAICPGLKPPIWLGPVRKLKLLLWFGDTAAAEDVDTAATDVAATFGVDDPVAGVDTVLKLATEGLETNGLVSAADLVIFVVTLVNEAE